MSPTKFHKNAHYIDPAFDILHPLLQIIDVGGCLIVIKRIW